MTDNEFFTLHSRNVIAEQGTPEVENNGPDPLIDAVGGFEREGAP